ncbi:MAG TPA: Vms1/Ankzf1 family peptidyl-tRNA hydrolase [Dehalococcoidia bacterium]|nr:Vms1/Ankzf1 family peptidyl-tRNA hydrolase [Dehalococcoidia bacterium]
MTTTLSHTDLTRGRLLRLLDAIDSAAGEIALTAALLPGEPLPPAVAAVPHAALLEAYRQRAESGAVLFLGERRGRLVVPPYPLRASFCEPGGRTAPLRDLLASAPRIAAVLLRLGGWAIGVYDGETLVQSRNDTRFVKNRHRKGGQSQRRFDRIREKQVHELFGGLCAAAEAQLAPWLGRLDYLAYGGDRHTVQAALKECRFLRDLPCSVLPRFLSVPEPRHETLERLPVLLSTSHVLTVEEAAPA